MSASLHPAAPHDLPGFIAGPEQSDWLMSVMAVVLLLAILMFGILFLRLHSLPERIAHRSHKIQFEIVAEVLARAHAMASPATSSRRAFSALRTQVFTVPSG